MPPLTIQCVLCGKLAVTEDEQWPLCESHNEMRALRKARMRLIMVRHPVLPPMYFKTDKQMPLPELRELVLCLPQWPLSHADDECTFVEIFDLQQFCESLPNQLEL